MKKLILTLLISVTSTMSVYAKDVCTTTNLEEGAYSYQEVVFGGTPDAVVNLDIVSDDTVKIQVLLSGRTSSFKEGRTYFLKLINDSKSFNCKLELYNENHVQIVALDNTINDNFNVNDFNSRAHTVGASRLLLQTSGFGGCNTQGFSGGSCGPVHAEFKRFN